MAINAGNSFRTRDKLNVGAQTFDIHRLEFLEKQGVADRRNFLFHCAYFWRIWFAARMAGLSMPRTFGRWRAGDPGLRKKTLLLFPRASCCRTLLACLRSSISPRCAKRYNAWGAVPNGSIRWSPPSWSLIIPCRGIILAT